LFVVGQILIFAGVFAIKFVQSSCPSSAQDQRVNRRISMQLSNIPYITLWAVNFDEMISFYLHKLELPLEFGDDNFVQFATQGTKLYIHRMGAASSLRDHTVEIHFDVPDVDAAYNELKQRGVRFAEPPANRPWGARMAALRDPEGYAIEIVGPLDPNEPIPSY
jgi:catechol 2,3-dioxygenase-like lactoylglutathione lyase family enzyme